MSTVQTIAVTLLWVQLDKSPPYIADNRQCKTLHVMDSLRNVSAYFLLALGLVAAHPGVPTITPAPTFKIRPRQNEVGSNFIGYTQYYGRCRSVLETTIAFGLHKWDLA